MTDGLACTPSPQTLAARSKCGGDEYACKQPKEQRLAPNSKPGVEKRVEKRAPTTGRWGVRLNNQDKAKYRHDYGQDGTNPLSIFGTRNKPAFH